MANTLTDLIPDLYAGLDIVSRELTGMIPAVAMNADAARAAVGESVRVPITGAANVGDIAPAMTTPEPTDQAVSNVAINITKARAAEFGFVGESQRGLNNGLGYRSIQANMIAQAMRSLVNEVESDLTSLYWKASRAHGTAGTTAFATNLSDTAQLHKILVDNGAPTNDKQLVIDTTNGAAMRTLTQLTKANEASDTSLLRQGVLLDVHGFAIRETGQEANHVAGTGAGFLLSAAAVEGATTIAVDTGTGTILQGDVVTFAGDTNRYVVTTALGGGTFTIAAPGLRQDAADNTAVTVTAGYSASMAFDRNAIQLVARAPAVPEEGDSAIDRMVIQDPISGLAFEVSIYPGYRKVRYEIALAWGMEVIKPAHLALLLS